MTNSVTHFHELLLKKEVGFVCYRVPGQNTETLLSFQPKQVLDLTQIELTKKKNFLFAPFEMDQLHPIWILESDELLSSFEIDKSVIEKLNGMPDCNPVDLEKLESTSKEVYVAAFQNMMHELQTEILDKVILSKIKVLQPNQVSLFSLFEKLEEAYPHAFVYLIHLPDGSNWLGASPEVLLAKQNNLLKTMALAGTQVLGSQNISNIQWKKKEQEEQVYVRKYVKAILQEFFDENQILESDTYTSQAGNLVHLCTDFEIESLLRPKIFLRLVNQLHPTPAICGIPMEKSKQCILNVETHKRDYYTGFLGPISADFAHLYVNLRCMQVIHNQVVLYTGGGITRDSEMEKEWQETEAKAQTLLSVFMR
ncbi:MAG: isochorismate synthase [Bacteroidales bacterium]|nr:isochorismate synthase [Bacteroidales bacterium]